MRHRHFGLMRDLILNSRLTDLIANSKFSRFTRPSSAFRRRRRRLALSLLLYNASCHLRRIRHNYSPLHP